jgi:hypothetical protein
MPLPRFPEAGPRPFLTIGIPCYDEFENLQMTVEAIFSYHQEAVPLIEILVIDNHPYGLDANNIAEFVREAANERLPIRYIPLYHYRGTALAQEAAFAYGNGAICMSIDCHILLYPGSLARTIRFFMDRGYDEAKHLYHGPGWSHGTAYVSWRCNEWGSGMLGKWDKYMKVHELGDEPIEIDGMGTGAFLCGKDFWPKYPSWLLGFGGVECTLHENFRRLNRKVYSLPWLLWWHMYRRSIRHYVDSWDKLRNYVIYFRRLGYSDDAIRAGPIRHFVETQNISSADADSLLQPNVYGLPPRYRPSEISSLTSLDAVHKYSLHHGNDNDLSPIMANLFNEAGPPDLVVAIRPIEVLPLLYKLYPKPLRLFLPRYSWMEVDHVHKVAGLEGDLRPNVSYFDDLAEVDITANSRNIWLCQVADSSIIKYWLMLLSSDRFSGTIVITHTAYTWNYGEGGQEGLEKVIDKVTTPAFGYKLVKNHEAKPGYVILRRT